MHSYCTIPDCDKSHHARGWCKKHYLRWLRYGNPYSVAWQVGDPIARFWSKVNTDGPKGCWLWLGVKNTEGYGRLFGGNRKKVYAHRFAYELLVGPIPATFVIDHLCRTPDCVNPAHMEPVTEQVNILRGKGASARNAAKTHCPQGHVYDLFNTYMKAGGGRRCHQCGH